MTGCRSGTLLGCLLAVPLASCNQPEPVPAATIGLSTSLPIYWAESADPADLLARGGETPWPRVLIESRHKLVPLDSLAANDALEQVDAVLLAQPRPLAAEENVALDRWVRAGGHVLVFADPALTAESRFPLGDKRRPQDVALLSPILSRWGLELQFDESQDSAERIVRDPIAGPVPVRLAGRLRLIEGAAEPGDRCELGPGALVAHCRIGAGEATVVADAALLDTGGDVPTDVREAALERLVDSLARAAVGSAGDKWGRSPPAGVSEGVNRGSDGKDSHD